MSKLYLLFFPFQTYIIHNKINSQTIKLVLNSWTYSNISNQFQISLGYSNIPKYLISNEMKQFYLISHFEECLSQNQFNETFSSLLFYFLEMLQTKRTVILKYFTQNKEMPNIKKRQIFFYFQKFYLQMLNLCEIINHVIINVTAYVLELLVNGLSHTNRKHQV